MLSILMPAKDASKYIHSAINGLSTLKVFDDFELIVVEDHSSDDTLDILRNLESKLTFLKVYVNPGQGKIEALNYAYSLAKGDFIKTIDADDVFTPCIDSMSIFIDSRYDVVLHGAVIVDQSLNRIGTYHVNPNYLKGDKIDVVSRLVSLPRWSFSFSRKVSDSIFPIPIEMEYEDVWISIIIKLNSFKLFNYKNPNIYLYRQHDNQAFGGILSADRSLIIKRANTILSMINYIEKLNDLHPVLLNFSAIRKYNSYLIKNNFVEVLIDKDLNIPDKVKCLLYSYGSFFIPFAFKVKWFFDSQIKLK